jgi:branched-chain amino acid transport system permease protein
MTLARNRSVLTLVVIALVLVLAPLVLSKAGLVLATEFCAVLAIALMWNLLAGFAGIVLIGIPLFIGIGGYTLYLTANWLGIAPYPSILAAAAVSALASVVLAPVLFRLQGAQLAIGSWVLAEIARLAILLTPALGAGGGLNLEVMKLVKRGWRLPLNYSASALVLFIALMVTIAIMRSRLGLGLRALRDSEPAASAMGVDVASVRLVTLVIAAAITGAAGGAYYISSLQITPGGAFSLNWIAIIIFVVILGGIGSVEGPIIGAIVYFLLRETLSGLGPAYFVLAGLLAIGVTIFMPEGVWGLIRRLFKIDLLSVIQTPNHMTKEN